MKKISVMMVLVASICFIACNKTKNEKENVIEKMPVKVMDIGFSSEDASRSYVGIIQESVSIPLSFSTLGTVETVLVSEGQYVHKGQLLASLNNASYRDAYQISFSKEKQAQDGYNRLVEVYKKGSLPEVKMVEIETQLQQAKSSTQMSKKSLDDCNLYAPTDGVIGKRSVEPGMNVAGNTVFNLVKIEKVYAVVSIPENEIPQTNIGQKATIVVSALSNKEFKGTITEKGVMANVLSHTYDVKISIPNGDKALKPGMVCNVMIERKDASNNKLAVPMQAVLSDNNSKYVYLFDAKTSKAVKRQVVIGELLENGFVVIKEGLQKGDVMIVEGYQKINENSLVEIK